MSDVIHINIQDDNGRHVFSDFVGNVVDQHLNRRLDVLLLEAAEFRTTASVITEYVHKQGYWIMKSFNGGYGYVVDEAHDLRKLQVFATYSDALKDALSPIDAPLVEPSVELVNSSENR